MDHVDRILEQWAEQRPDLDTSAMGLIGRLKRLSHYVEGEMEQTFARLGLNLSSFDVLATLLRSGPPYQLSPGELIASSMVTSGTMTNRINQLEKQGMIERRKNPKDGRGAIIALTALGHDTISQAVAEHVVTQKSVVSELSVMERKSLDALLRRFLERYDND